MWASEAQNPLALTGNLLGLGKWANVNVQPWQWIILSTEYAFTLFTLGTW